MRNTNRKYSYRIDGWTIKKIFRHQYYSKIGNRIFDDFNEMQTKVLYLNKFWKGFVFPFDVSRRFEILFDHIGYMEEEQECVHMYLDTMKAPRTENGETLSIVGRIKSLLESKK